MTATYGCEEGMIVNSQGSWDINARLFIGGYVAGSRRMWLERCNGGEVFVLAAAGNMETSKRIGTT